MLAIVRAVIDGDISRSIPFEPVNNEDYALVPPMTEEQENEVKAYLNDNVGA